MNDKYPLLEQDHERRNMSDKEILEKYVDLEKYKDASSLRDKIGMCPTKE